MSADSSGNGHRPNTSGPSIPQGALGGGVRESHIQKSREAVKLLDRLAPKLVDVCGFVWEWTSAKYNSPLNTQGAFRGFRGSHIQKSGEAVKRLDRLAPNLAYMCRFIWEWIHAKHIAPRDTRGHLGVLGGQTFKSLGKLSNGWTDWHQLWITSADSSGNGHTPKKLPLETKGSSWAGLGVKHSKVLRSCQTSGQIGTIFGSRLRIRLRMNIG